ncbi:spoIIIJ-associated protein [Desulfovibrionales bacterium]
MEDLKDFEGKSMNEAIAAACTHFDCEPSQLKIEIITKAKSGIFGLVGARKAQIRVQKQDENYEVKALVTDILERLLPTILDKLQLEIAMDQPDRIKVLVHNNENSGLLIGRGGQTLAAIQYITNRIVSKKWPKPMRVHIDVGNYRERQDNSLRQLALHLANKAKSLGRPQSTKPISSYHRRLVHVTLHDDQAIITRSIGEGPLKRVLIVPSQPDSPPLPNDRFAPSENQ